MGRGIFSLKVPFLSTRSVLWVSVRTAFPTHASLLGSGWSPSRRVSSSHRGLSSFQPCLPLCVRRVYVFSDRWICIGVSGILCASSPQGKNDWRGRRKAKTKGEGGSWGRGWPVSAFLLSVSPSCRFFVQGRRRRHTLLYPSLHQLLLFFHSQLHVPRRGKSLSPSLSLPSLISLSVTDGHPSAFGYTCIYVYSVHTAVYTEGRSFGSVVGP